MTWLDGFHLLLGSLTMGFAVRGFIDRSLFAPIMLGCSLWLLISVVLRMTGQI